MVSGTNIIFLNLSHNQIRGELPRGLGDMQQVQAIDLSWNNFTGTISPQLGLCRELEVLDLSHNLLTGVLPSSLDLLKDLKNLDVSNNSLTGEIPATLTKCTSLKHFNLSYNDFVGLVPHHWRLCGLHLPVLHWQPTALRLGGEAQLPKAPPMVSVPEVFGRDVRLRRRASIRADNPLRSRCLEDPGLASCNAGGHVQGPTQRRLVTGDEVQVPADHTPGAG